MGAGKSVLGICPGNLILADILDACVYENRHVKKGRLPIRAPRNGDKPEFKVIS